MLLMPLEAIEAILRAIQQPAEPCQEIGLVAIMFFFELLFSYVSSSISFYDSFANLFLIIPFPYLPITRDTQDEGEARFRFYRYKKQSKSNFTT